MGDTPESFTARLFDAHKALERRLGRKVFQQDVAERVGELAGRTYTQAAVSNWFRGAVPDLETIRAISDFYGITPAWLAFGGGPRYPVEGSGAHVLGEATP